MVKVISGRDLGKTGRVLSVERSTKRILVESVQMVKHHMKANPQKNIKGGILERESLVSSSNVMLLCPSCGPIRPKVQTLPDGKKSRSCRKCGNTLV
ncbi:MAG: 50S ribosomal protein L24 [Acidobacteria bacterium RIFCSPLOWO2_12_FULL_54_10]|nr:MAG: 50S ribosomal protein L24 [Acidobacteria bacterium RIFCSPLOWO2_12_FULL_54_10]